MKALAVPVGLEGHECSTGSSAMSDIETLIRRIDALEMRLSHQDRTIEDLNAMVMAQWQEIEKLSRQIVRLSDQVQEAGDSAAGEGPEPPPPHY